MSIPYNKIHSDSDVRIGGRTLKKGETVFELLDSIEGVPPAADRPQPISEAELRQIITEAVERIARDVVPEVADRVIREEIEKLKNS
ncbi:MAG: hypothetical protein ABFD62_00465 [Syntrophaceae bacterium]